MAIEFICDGCGKKEPAKRGYRGEPIKPPEWFSRIDGEGEQHACCRNCVQIVAKKTGKTQVVAPF